MNSINVKSVIGAYILEDAVPLNNVKMSEPLRMLIGMHGYFKNNENINLKDDILQEILGNFNHICLKYTSEKVQFNRQSSTASQSSFE